MIDVSVEGVCRDFQAIKRAGSGYGAVPESYRRAEQTLILENPQSAQEFNRALYHLLLRRFSLSEALIRLPERITALYSKEAARLERNIVERPIAYFASGNDSFRKDLALLTHRLIPCGAEFFYPFAGIPRSLSVRGGLIDLVRFIAAVHATRGLKPLLELHIHSDVTDSFTPDGWLDTYDNLADVLELNPEFLGVQSFSWFLDPALERISPHLAYLRQVPERCGAYIFYSGDEPPLSSAAVRKSRRRRLLAESGEYQPKTYARIWPRKKLLQRQWRCRV